MIDCTEYGSEEDDVTYGYIEEIHGKRASADTTTSSTPNNNKKFNYRDNWIQKSLLLHKNFDYDLLISVTISYYNLLK